MRKLHVLRKPDTKSAPNTYNMKLQVRSNRQGSGETISGMVGRG